MLIVIFISRGEGWVGIQQGRETDHSFVGQNIILILIKATSVTVQLLLTFSILKYIVMLLIDNQTLETAPASRCTIRLVRG